MGSTWNRGRWKFPGAVAGAIMVPLWLTSSSLALEPPGAVHEVSEGTPAPVAGLLFDDSASKRVVEDLRDGRALAAKLETVHAILAARDRQIQDMDAQIRALMDEARARGVALALAEDRDQRRQEQQARLLTALGQAERATERAGKALERAEQRIEQLQRQGFWRTLVGTAGFIGALLAGFYAR